MEGRALPKAGNGFLLPSTASGAGGVIAGSVASPRPLGALDSGGDLGKAQPWLRFGKIHLAPLNLRRAMGVCRIAVSGVRGQPRYKAGDSETALAECSLFPNSLVHSDIRAPNFY